jgi:hypothetical protein
MSQDSDFSRPVPVPDRLEDEHLSAICHSLQFHLTEPTEAAHQMRWRAVSDPCTDPQVLQHIASRGSHHLQKRVAEHAGAAPETLDQLAVHDHHEVRASLADNQNISLQLQWQLARDPHPDVRFATAQSYHIDPDVLASLLDDDNPFVVHRAKTTLQRISAAKSRTAYLPGSAGSAGTSKKLYRASG